LELENKIFGRKRQVANSKKAIEMLMMVFLSKIFSEGTFNFEGNLPKNTAVKAL